MTAVSGFSSVDITNEFPGLLLYIASRRNSVEICAIPVYIQRRENRCSFTPFQARADLGPVWMILPLALHAVSASSGHARDLQATKLLTGPEVAQCREARKARPSMSKAVFVDGGPHVSLFRFQLHLFGSTKKIRQQASFHRHWNCRYMFSVIGVLV
jgi:hypothetical protein